MTEEPIAAPRHRGYYAIAHRAGNNLHQTEEALRAGVDAIECDFWHSRGRLSLRHERKFPGLPVLYDKWYVRFSWGRLSLRDLLKEINFRAELYLDIKSSTPRAADALLELYADNEAMMPPARVSSDQWRLLDRIAAARTEMRMYYSVGKPSGIDALLRRMEREHPPAGTSIRHTLLTPEVIARLHAAGLDVCAWTVNSVERAEEILSWGVDGIISDNLHVFELQAPASALRDAKTG